jgi:dTDP-4-dehydrorhamnose reductase
MNCRILLFGKNGQIGAELARFLPSLGEVVALGREELDFSIPSRIREAIHLVKPQVIVNAAAYTAVDRAESERKEARIINADGPAVIAEEAKRVGAALVHYSTDYVFDGTKTHPYLEDDLPNPLNVYGETKLAGEQAIRSEGIPYLILRTSWVYGRKGRNFLLTILRRATELEELRVVDDQIGAPTWSREIARGTIKLLEKVLNNDHAPLRACTGIYHITANGETSWFEFAKAILFEVSQTTGDIAWITSVTSGRPMVTRRIIPVRTAEYPALARRPAYSVLSSARLQQVFQVQLPDWRTELHEVFGGPENKGCLPAGLLP